jgi:phenylalanyl-tRNA synthetase beta chain
MKLSEAWLREWVDPRLDTAALAEQLTMAGLEVDAVEPAAPPFGSVVVAQILSADRHPNADRLRVCAVEAGQGVPLTVVCGAANARAGLCVPLALPGAELPGGLKISRSTVRGVESAGMLCSAKELGLSDDAEGLLELPPDAPVGRSLRDYLQLDDAVLALELTPNRGDCLSVQGLAREVAVLNRLTLAGPASGSVAAAGDETRPVRIENAAACTRYAGRVVTGISPGAVTPLWMRERLRRAGLRSIHPVVDITNYVLLELGQPMHAFDLARLQGGIVVRNAQAGERLQLLDGQTVELHESTLVIADGDGPVAMAGVMGGLPTAVGAQTTDIFFESACFTPQAVAGQGRRYKLHTDSLHRFERGVDPALQVRAIERATQLLLEIAGGKPGPVIDVRSQPQAAGPTLRLRHARLTRLLGAEVEAAEVERILRALDMRVESGTAGEWRVTPPSWRYDIAIEADLIEEVARIHGYARLPLRAHQVSLPAVSETEARLPEARLRECLVQRGYQEAVTYSFVEPQLQAQLDPATPAIDLDNPIAAPLAQMRTTLWSSLLPVWLYNLQRQQGRVRLFELGMRFMRDPGAPNGIRQTPMLAGLASGPARPEQWALPTRAVDFYDLKADVEALLALGGAGDLYRFEKPGKGLHHPALHPGQSAQVVRRSDGRAIGWLGRLSPALSLQIKALEGEQLPLVYELEAAALREARLPAARPISEFPFIRRDLAIVIAEEHSAQAVLDCVQAAGEALLQDVLIFDVYRGQGLQSGCKSVALGLIFQDYSRTLTDTEVDQSIARLQDRLNKVLGATVRG